MGPHSRNELLLINIFLSSLWYQSKKSPALSSATQHAIPGLGCFSTRFPLPTVVYAGISVKQIYLFLFIFFQAYKMDETYIIIVSGDRRAYDRPGLLSLHTLSHIFIFLWKRKKRAFLHSVSTKHSFGNVYGHSYTFRILWKLEKKYLHG